jgi:hypothetical protein
VRQEVAAVKVEHLQRRCPNHGRHDPCDDDAFCPCRDAFCRDARCRDNRADNSCSRHNIADRRDKAHRCNIVMAVGFSLSSAL